jgi:hypothetical protein
LVQVDYARVVDLDIGASKSDICAIRVVTISERAGRCSAEGCWEQSEKVSFDESFVDPKL